VRCFKSKIDSESLKQSARGTRAIGYLRTDTQFAFKGINVCEIGCEIGCGIGCEIGCEIGCNLNNGIVEIRQNWNQKIYSSGLLENTMN